MDQTPTLPLFLPEKIQKRNGKIVPYDREKIKKAVGRALLSTFEAPVIKSELVAEKVEQKLSAWKEQQVQYAVPSVELIQDLVEKSLMEAGYLATAKAYILYRQKHAEIRAQKGEIEDEYRDRVLEDKKYFTSQYSQFIFYQMYSRWRAEWGRRETWTETISRFVDFMRENLGEKLSDSEYEEIREAILRQKVCPSMRLLWSAGDACRESSVWAYNCSYIAPVKPEDLGEIMYILMCGAGLGFTVESENVEQFPQIKKQTGQVLPPYAIEDSKEGWAKAFVLGMKSWYEGLDIVFDYSNIRPAGARLKTAGGRASGPDPLRRLMEFTRSKMLSKQGKRLRSIDLHDIICKIGEIVVAGGVRRSALISLSEFGDASVRDAKKGQFYLTEPQRSLANNSAIYDEKPPMEEFLEEWLSLIKSRSGERGIYNRGSLQKQLPQRRWEKLKGVSQVGLNPCGEIYLRSKQFCNLSSVVVRADDTRESLFYKIKMATLLGTYQSMLTNFKYLSKEWEENCQEERLLGVSITGYYDNEIVRDDTFLEELRDYAIKINCEFAERFGINPSTAITCIKPHGNSGQLLGVGSGMHPWFSQYYVRRVRISAADPLFTFAKDQGIPYHPEVGQSAESAITYVLEFPVKAPEKAITKDEVSAYELLKEWERLKLHFVEHNPSVTIYVGPDEWIDVAHYIYKNWDIIGGLSFLPRSDHVYELAPYQSISKEEYEQRSEKLGNIDFAKLALYEASDTTSGAREFACVAGVCEIV